MGNTTVVDITSVPGKIIVQVPFAVTSGYMKKNMFVNGNLTKLIYFHDEITRSMDVGRSVDVTYLDFGKAFNMISHSIFIVTTGWLKKSVWVVRLKDSD